MDRDPPRVPPTLDSEQFALWSSEPDAARSAVEAVAAELGASVPEDVLVPLAARGALEAAASFDASRGVPYRQWALYFAAYRLWEELRRTYGDDKALRARIRLGMFRFMAHHQRFFDVWRDTRESDERALRAFTDGVLFTGAMELDATGAITRGIEDVVQTEAARRTGEALRVLVGELSPEQLYLLRSCAAYGEPVKVVAKHLQKGYRTVLDDFHELKARCGARLAGLLGTKELPPWHPEIRAGCSRTRPTPRTTPGAEGSYDLTAGAPPSRRC